MIVEVRLFAAARDQAGSDSLQVELPAGATVAQLREQLAQQHGELSPLLAHAMFAVDAAYAREDDVIPATAEVACIPPVSGG